ncbi:MAG: hypothetical protein E7352_03775 [Clostridiales bacterium]|nr:hypothetical protein [Clostridiales bacterium]
MEKKENVYGEQNATEKDMKEKAETGEQNGLPQEVSTVAGKFKDVSALVRAYESLQAEFTRRSQRLKELEKLAENLNEEKGAEGSDKLGAEKLRKTAESRREKAKAFDEFVLDVNKARDEVRPDGKISPTATAEKSDENAENTANEQGRVETTEKEEDLKAEKEGVVDAEKTLGPSVAGNVPSAEELYLQVCRDEGVRLRIIGEYLSSVGRSAPPITAAGVGTFVSPPRKAKSIGDAATMALQYFKKP